MQDYLEFFEQDELYLYTPDKKQPPDTHSTRTVPRRVIKVLYVGIGKIEYQLIWTEKYIAKWDKESKKINDWFMTNTFAENHFRKIKNKEAIVEVI